MAISKFIEASLPLVTLIMTACTGNDLPSQPQVDQTTADILTPNDIILPIKVGQNNTWRCKDDTVIETQFIDNHKTTLKVLYQGKEHMLIHRASRRPVIYEDHDIAFYSDGDTAVIGRPLSDQIYHSDCRP